MDIVYCASDQQIKNIFFCFRHSMEILNPPINKQTMPQTDLPKVKDKTQKNLSKSTNDSATKNSSNKAVISKQSYQSQRHHPTSNTASNAVVALYPYKPQKTDELELKKGCKDKNFI